MRRILFPVLAMTSLLACASFAQDGRAKDESPRDASKEDRSARPKRAEASPEAQSRPDNSAHAPLVIQMGRPSHDDSRKNVRAQDRDRAAPTVQDHDAHRPTYGQMRRPEDRDAPAQGAGLQGRPGPQTFGQPAASEPVPHQHPDAVRPQPPDQHTAHAVSHHPYERGYVRQKLQKLGVKSEPGFITDRSELMLTDRRHSIAPRPQRGPDDRDLRGTPIPRHEFEGDLVRGHMARIDRPEFLERLAHLDDRESERNHHYWHREDGFFYSHYVDDGGYDWYGWYLGDRFFWTRNLHDRWWWYDDAFGRWCFWNDGFWWWQDPNHVGDLYCYHADTYIPCNSADDEIAVSAGLAADAKQFKSPDGTRVVKVFGESNDAFLYDATTPARFDPVYLASGVQDVEFSSPRNGKPLQAILKLDDGTFDVIDAKQGSAYTESRSIAD